jgi:hypothetical protein
VHNSLQDHHGLVGDTGIGVNLFEYLVDVGRVGFLTLALSLLLVTICGGRGLLGSLAGLSSSGFLIDKSMSVQAHHRCIEQGVALTGCLASGGSWGFASCGCRGFGCWLGRHDWVDRVLLVVEGRCVG